MEKLLVRCGRVHHTKDAKWLEYDSQLMSKTCGFDEALKLAALNVDACMLQDGVDQKQFDEEHRATWTKHMTQWMRDGRKSGRKLSDDDSKPPMFAAVPMCVATLPFELLKDTGKLPTHELERINWFRLYYSIPLIAWERAPQVSYSGVAAPMFPPAFGRWVDDNHNRCTFWINYCCYERASNLKPLLSFLAEPCKSNV